jgi:hypothetical protein
MTESFLFLNAYTMIVIFKCYTTVEIPSFLYIITVFTILPITIVVVERTGS